MTLIEGALTLKTQTAGSTLKPLSQVIMLDIDSVLDQRFIANLLATKKKRFPIYDGNRNNICGIIMPRDFLRSDIREIRKISSFTMRRPLVVNPSTTLLEMLNMFQTGARYS
jgi:CBS domain containing-hemolysin-like protein